MPAMGAFTSGYSLTSCIDLSMVARCMEVAMIALSLCMLGKATDKLTDRFGAGLGLGEGRSAADVNVDDDVVLTVAVVGTMAAAIKAVETGFSCT